MPKSRAGPYGNGPFQTRVCRADHVIFMYMGEVVEAGPAREVFHDPKEKRTKEFLAGVF